MSHEIENFFGVYLLYNINPKYKGRTYIGFTVNPNRRVNQHNKGSQFGGAKKTSGKGPWDMVLIVHGFPNKISALRFEWAWQNPKTSRRLRHLPMKRKSENSYQYCFRIVSEMLRTSPWNRLPLIFRWLKQEYQMDFAPNLQPPNHMPMQYGPVVVKSLTQTQKSTKAMTQTQKSSKSSSVLDDEEDDDELLPVLSQVSRPRCAVCAKKLAPEDNVLSCLVKSCNMKSHTLCLARSFLESEGCQDTQLLPVTGQCPVCHQQLLWGDLIRFKAGCYQNNSEMDVSTLADHWANDLQY